MESIVFLHPYIWLLTFLLGIGAIWLYYQTKKFASHFQFIADIEAVFWKSKSYFYVNLSILFLLMVFFSFLFADPHQKGVKEKIIREGIDIALVLDLSYSMMAEDMAPNRLEVAKEVIADFTSQLQTDRVGLILFSGKPFTGVPLTFDYDFITNFVKNISIQTINQDYHHLQGTAIWDGLLYGAHLFDDPEREKVIVLLTDGEANRGIDPIEAMRYIREKNIIVHTVWIAWDEETYVNFQNVYGIQKIAIGGIDEENLQAIANLTGGKYFRARSNETFSKIFEELNLLEKKEIEIEKMLVFQPYYKPFVYVIFFLFTLFIGFNSYYFLRN